MSSSNGAPVVDAANASYLFSPPGGVAEGSSACKSGGLNLAACTFPAGNNASTRAWSATCPAGTINTSQPAGTYLTLTDTSGNMIHWYVVDGDNGPYADKIAAYSGNAIQPGNADACEIVRR